MSAQPEGAKARRVARLGLTAMDLARTRRFYEALGFATLGTEAVAKVELALLGVWGSQAERLSMRLGRQEVEFLRFDPPGRPYPSDSTSTDLWFQHFAIAVDDMSEAHRLAMAAGANAITRGGPQTLPPNTGRVAAFKFRDPDGHPLELLHFPPGTGEKVWQRGGRPAPFLGIDHTAISVADPARSQRFYEEMGLSVGSRSHNQGPAQERLDDVAGDRCEVVALTLPHEPPHIELLGYAIGTRRPMPSSTRADDIWATRIFMDVASLGAAAQGAPLPDGSRAGLIRDPDGHALVLVEGGPAGSPIAT